MSSTVLGLTLTRNALAIKSGKILHLTGSLDGFSQVCCSHGVTQIATLKAVHGEKYEYPEPFPYWKKPYHLTGTFYDYTKWRFGENSKIITVEGNLAVGKKQFAQELAKEFDMHYIGPTPELRCFTKGNKYGFDIRELDHLLPESTRAYDLKRFYSDKHPEKGTVGRLLLAWYKEKWMDYARALEHLSHTGQGVVMVRSAYSDIVFMEALRSMGYITKAFVDYYNLYRDNTICEFLKPHLAIYLDAPISVIRERIKERNDSREVNSAVLSDKYLQAISDAYQKKFLPYMRKHGEVIEMDWTEKPTAMDVDSIAEELQSVKLEPESNDDVQFEDWTRSSEDDWNILRLFLGSEDDKENTFNLPQPWDCPEIMVEHDDSFEFRKIMDNHPVFKYDYGYNHEMGHNVLFKL